MHDSANIVRTYTECPDVRHDELNNTRSVQMLEQRMLTPFKPVRKADIQVISQSKIDRLPQLTDSKQQVSPLILRRQFKQAERSLAREL